MGRRVGVAALALGAIILSFLGGDGGVGFDYSVVDGIATVSASTSLVAIIAAVVVLVAYVISIESKLASGLEAKAGAWSRGFGWFTDLYLSLLATASFLALLPLWREATRSGSFEWGFVRHEATTTDWVIGTALTVAEFACVALYWTVPVRTGGQTIGQAIFGIRTVPIEGTRPSWIRAFGRGLLQPFAMLWWIGSLFSPKGEYVHDQIARVKVVRSTSPSSPS